MADTTSFRPQDVQGLKGLEGLESLDDLTESLYEALRKVAKQVLGRQRNVINGTDLVHEAYIELARDEKYRVLERSHFLALSAILVRRLLVREATARRKERRKPCHITSTNLGEEAADSSFELLELETALNKLARVDGRQARIVELRFFGGLSSDEVANLLDISRRTVSKEWGMARAWLRRELA